MNLRYAKIFLLSAILVTTFTISGCIEVVDLDAPPQFSTTSTSHAQLFNDTFNPNDNWLIYWYICGSNLESDYGAATKDIQEMLNAKIPANVKVLIQAGGSNQWRNAVIKSGATNLLLYSSDGLQELVTAEDSDMGDAETVASFLQFGKDNFQADHRVFVFWDHGGGSVFGLCHDERTNNTLSLNELRDAFAAVFDANTENPPFEVIGFDTCLMATYETANTLYGYSHYMVASEEVEPGNGWQYTSWLKSLGENPAMSGARLGQIMCDGYYAGCKDNWTEDTATLSVIDLTKIPNLKTAYENFGVEALRLSAQNPRKFFSSLGRNAKYSENYGGNTREKGYYDMIDIGDLAENSKDLLPQTSATLIRAVDDAVIHKVQGPYRNKGGGISGFYPYSGNDNVYAMYTRVNAAPDSQKYLYHHLLRGAIPSEAKEILASTGLQELPQPLGESLFDISTLEDLKIQVDKKNNAFVQLTPAQLENIAYVNCNLAYVDTYGGIVLYLGSDANVKIDWKKGTVTDNFDATWPMLDGHPVYIEVTAVQDDYNLYSIPILLNGVRVNLEAAYQYSTNQYKIFGARGLSDSAGLSDKNLIKLKEGDTITTLHYGISIEGEDTDFTEAEVDTFTLKKNFNLADEKIGEGEYLYCFEFVTPNNESASSQFINFTVDENGTITTKELEE